jgi:hypothetical protein
MFAPKRVCSRHPNRGTTRRHSTREIASARYCYYKSHLIGRKRSSVRTPSGALEILAKYANAAIWTRTFFPRKKGTRQTRVRAAKRWKLPNATSPSIALGAVPWSRAVAQARHAGE